MVCPSPTINNNVSSIHKRDLDQIDQIASDVVESIEELIRVIEGTTKRAFVQEGEGESSFAGKDGEVKLPVGFIMDGVQDLLRWSDYSQVTMKYLPDPEYKKFDNARSTLSGRVLQLSVSCMCSCLLVRVIILLYEESYFSLRNKLIWLRN